MGIEAPMHRLHESVEVHAQLSFLGQAMEEDIHEVGLAAPHPAP